MIRTITGFHQDDLGDWVAEFSCAHNQHLRHRPPFESRPWVVDDRDRRFHLGTPIDCPLCSRHELPEGLTVLRTLGPWGTDELPRALLRSHCVRDGQWALLRVLEGALVIHFEADAGSVPTVEVRAGERAAIPPGVEHWIACADVMIVELDFLGSLLNAGSEMEDVT